VPINYWEKLKRDLIRRQNMMTLILLGCICALLVGLVMTRKQVMELKNERNRLNSILNALPFPISVTDMNKKWIFVNKPVEKILNKKLEDLYGHPCHKWGANICNTEHCGITCLEKGKDKTYFSDGNSEYQVDLSYIYDEKGEKCGHVEVVQDISHLNQSLKIQEMQQNLIMDTSKSTERFSEIAQQVNKSAVELSENAVEQASIIQEFIASINELSANIERNIEHITGTNQISLNAKEKANIGTNHMKNMIVAMEDINKASTNIAEVIKVIENIASQTNLLALNAAIESARAGEAGRGFSVVANEIRDLANKSSETVKEVEGIIQETFNIVRKGQGIVQDADTALNNIVQTIDETVATSKQLLENSEGQRNAIQELTAGTKQLSAITETNVTNSAENSAISEEMLLQIEQLREIINK